MGETRRAEHRDHGERYRDVPEQRPHYPLDDNRVRTRGFQTADRTGRIKRTHRRHNEIARVQNIVAIEILQHDHVVAAQRRISPVVDPGQHPPHFRVSVKIRPLKNRGGERRYGQQGCDQKHAHRNRQPGSHHGGEQSPADDGKCHHENITFSHPDHQRHRRDRPDHSPHIAS